MIGALTNHLWQSTLFVIAAWLVAAALRKNGAHIRHSIWVVASLKFLVPFSLLVSLGGALAGLVPAPATIETPSTPNLSAVVNQLTQPFTSEVFDPSEAAIPTSTATTNWAAIFFAVWACGFIVVALMRLRDWRRIRAAVETSVPMVLAAPVPVRSSRSLLEPGVVGLWRPILLVPAGIEEHLTPAQLNAVLAHELCHVQRRDNLTSAIHMVVEAAFWFHPLVWFVGARLVDERERACDEHVLRVCGEPQIYAESILNVCKLYVESPLACVSGVGGADLRKRVAAILVNRIGLQLSLARKVTLAIAAMLAIVLPLVAGMLIAPASGAYAASARQARGAQSTAPIPKWDAISIKPCTPDAPPAGRNGGASPGYLYYQCVTLRSLVRLAYDHPGTQLLNKPYGPGGVPGAPELVRGGPSWAYSEKFVIEAKAEGVTDRDMLQGPMLLSLLEDRFQLKTHRATEQQSMLALTVAKTGLKIKPIAPGDCWELMPDKSVPPHAAGVAPCGFGGTWGSYEARGAKFGSPVPEGRGFVDELFFMLRRMVIDRTGLDGRYSFKFEFTPDDSTPGIQGRCGGDARCIAALASNGVSDARPTTFKSDDTIFKAVEKLGLKLEQVKAPAEYAVIDRAERPRPNDPADDPPARVQRAGPYVSDSAAAQTTAAVGQAAPKFDPVSIKPCVGNAPLGNGAAPPPPRGARGGVAPWAAQTTPGNVYWPCVTLTELVDQAYADQDHPLLNTTDRQRRDSLQPKRVRGGPSWVENETFIVEARASVDVTNPGLAGSTGRNLTALPAAMAQALRATLEDRFQLKVRRATEQQDMYALTIAKGGVNKERITTPKPGDCQTAADFFASGRTLAMYEDPKLCGRIFSTRDRGQIYWSFTMKQLALDLSRQMDHYVLDQTGLDGPFNFVLKGDQEPGSVEAFWTQAVEALGLKFQSTKAPAEYLVIDRVERPRPN